MSKTNIKNILANPFGNISRLARYNFVFIAIFSIYIVIFDGGNVLTRQAVYYRWGFVALLMVANSILWVVSKKSISKSKIFWALALWVLATLSLAGFMTYSERGMASMSTVLYVLPIVAAAFYSSFTYTFAVSILCSAVYLLACTKYFYDFFNEGYRVQLYGEIFFYSGVFMLTGWAVGRLVHQSAHKK